MQKYQAIPPLLRKVEELLEGTSTGKSEGKASMYKVASWSPLRCITDQ